MLSLCLQHATLFSQVSLMDACSKQAGSGRAPGANIRWERWGGGSKGEQEGWELGRGYREPGEESHGSNSSWMPWFKASILSSIPSGCKMMLVKGLKKK